MAFVSGIITSLGTGLVLLKNGIMMGTFQGFMAQKGLLLESVSSIWIHGTLEIFAIIVAGGAGIVMGNSIVFPGTYTRVQSFRNGAAKGAKIAIGLIPVFVVAAFLEGFVTRHTHIPIILKFTIIGLSLLFIILYFIIYPQKLKSNHLIYGKSIH